MVKHEQMMEMLADIGIDGNDKRMILNLYWDQKATVQIGEKQTEWIKIKKGVKQGCILSLNIFSLHSQKVKKNLEDL